MAAPRSIRGRNRTKLSQNTVDRESVAESIDNLHGSMPVEIDMATNCVIPRWTVASFLVALRIYDNLPGVRPVSALHGHEILCFTGGP